MRYLSSRELPAALKDRPLPLVRIDLVEGKPAAFRKQLGEVVYNAMRDTINVPIDDKFQSIGGSRSGARGGQSCTGIGRSPDRPGHRARRRRHAHHVDAVWRSGRRTRGCS